jgi:glycosyltransferase involved in cell wall biosynthesis
MEILLIDDGSVDEITPHIIKRLTRKYKNVKSFFFNDGGSGSASRPRNKGHELATSKYITYLDPDNEAVNNGYFKLFQQINGTDYDFIIGTMKTLSNKKELMAIYGKEEETINPVQLLVHKDFKPQSIQALIIRKDFILKHKLEMVVGAAGQDTLFFQELMINAKKVKITGELVHIYYSAVANSTVNTINKQYFNKVYLREVETYRRLRRYGLIDEYCHRRFERFFRLWYLKKLVNVVDTDIPKSAEILYKIYLTYKDNLKLRNKDVIRFIDLYEKKQLGLLYKEFIFSLRKS